MTWDHTGRRSRTGVRGLALYVLSETHDTGILQSLA